MNSPLPQHSKKALSLQARKQQLVRDAIWDAATDLFEDKGFDETTVEDIAEAAGVSRRSFFRYFASKNDLMAHGMVNYGAELTAAIEACPESYSLPEVFRETVRHVAQRSAANPRTRTILALVMKYPAARAAELSRFAEVQDLVANAYSRRCRKRGESELTARLLAGLTLQVTGITVRWWFEQDRPEITDALDQALATLDRLICENPGPGKRRRK